MSTTIVGGLRARIIRDSLYHMLHDSLEALGWFDTGRRHEPINFPGKPVDHLESVPFNTVALSDDNTIEVDLEMGSTALEQTTTYYVDFYAEDDSVGKHFIYDVRDILGGRMSTIGRDYPLCPVYDYRQATPPRIFSVMIERIVVDRAHNFPKPYQKHWYACRFDIIDSYSDEADNIDWDGGSPSGGGDGVVDGGSP